MHSIRDAEFIGERAQGTTKRTLSNDQQATAHPGHRANQMFEALVIDQSPHAYDQAVSILLADFLRYFQVAMIKLLRGYAEGDHVTTFLMTRQNGRSSQIVRRGRDDSGTAAQGRMQKGLEHRAKHLLAHHVTVVRDNQAPAMTAEK